MTTISNNETSFKKTWKNIGGKIELFKRPSGKTAGKEKAGKRQAGKRPSWKILGAKIAREKTGTPPPQRFVQIAFDENNHYLSMINQLT